MIDEDENEIAQTVMVSALAQILKGNEGIIIHQDGEGFIVYRNSVDKTITIIGDDDYLQLEHGKIIEMKYEDMRKDKNKGEGEDESVDFDVMAVNKNTTIH